MAGAAITFDFHNTLAQADEWFEIEVNGLVSSFLRWRSLDRGVTIDPETLWSADVAYRQLRHGIREHGNELKAEACVATILDELNIPFQEDEVERGVRALMVPALASTMPLPGAIETVRALKRAGVSLGVISSAVHHPFLIWTLDRFGIGGEFDVITTSASAGFYKSRPEIYWSALTALGADPKTSVHIGDSHQYDVDGARKAGMRTVLVSLSELDQDIVPRPDLTLSTLVGSAPIILELFARSAWVQPPNVLGSAK
ncbi:MAG: HAD family hydrolase [Thermomicrobiales bacterium]